MKKRSWYGSGWFFGLVLFVCWGGLGGCSGTSCPECLVLLLEVPAPPNASLKETEEEGLALTFSTSSNNGGERWRVDNTEITRWKQERPEWFSAELISANEMAGGPSARGMVMFFPFAAETKKSFRQKGMILRLLSLPKRKVDFFRTKPSRDLVQNQDKTKIEFLLQGIWMLDRTCQATFRRESVQFQAPEGDVRALKVSWDGEKERSCP